MISSKMSRMLVVLMLIFIALILINRGGESASYTTTDVSSPITENTTWTHANSPYVVTADIYVDIGVTLTIEPGVIVKFYSSKDLAVKGRLLAQGTASDPIVFTSIKDDAQGGDTNGDGTVTSPAPGDWTGIALTSTSTGSVLEYVWIGYGGYGDVPYAYANLHLFTSDVTFANSTIAHSSNRGIHVGGVDPAHDLVLTNNTFLNNSLWAVYDDTSGTRTNITLTGNISSGSAHNGYGLKGTIAGDVLFDSADDFPFIIWDNYVSLTIEQGGTLAFSPGTVIKFDRTSSDLEVNGCLLTQGTASAPIIFTSIKDDAHGGDTNGDGGATSPAPGDWAGIALTSASTGSVLEHAWIGYGGYGDTPYAYANLHLFTSNVTVSNNTIAYSSNRGIHVGGVVPSHDLVLTNNTFLNNSLWAVYDDTTGTRTDITLGGNTSSCSAHNGYGLKGTVAGDVLFDSTDDFPFIIWETGTSLSVDLGGTLTFSPGTVIKFDGLNSDLVVNGFLVVQGIESEPVIFTSIKDDAHGGDTNGNGTASTPGNGDWSFIQINGRASFNHAKLLYGSSQSYDGALKIMPGAEVDFADSTIQHARHKAVKLTGTGRLIVDSSQISQNWEEAVAIDGDEAWLQISRSQIIENGLVGAVCSGVCNNGNATVILGGDPEAGNIIMYNAGYGAYQAGANVMMLATHNYWGDLSGPYHEVNNPAGLGQAVSDRVVFDPWLTEAEAYPISGLVELQGPLSFSPGETFNLAVLFKNTKEITLNNTVVVVHLPELSFYIMSTEGGIYWPAEHAVVWKLGTVSPGESLNAIVRIITRWGIPPHSWTGGRVLVEASNLPNPALDLAEVLNFTPTTVQTETFLTPAEITLELAADSKLNALLQQAHALGFTFYDTALRETFAEGEDLLTLILLDRERMNQTVMVRRDNGRYTILHITPSFVTEYNDAGGWLYDQETNAWSAWGDMAASSDRLQTDSIRATCPTNKTPLQCLRNCLIKKAGSLLSDMSWFLQSTAGFGFSFGAPAPVVEENYCKLCRYEGTNCDKCTKQIVKIFPELRITFRDCWRACKKDANAMDCQTDSIQCAFDEYVPLKFNWYILREVCDPTNCDFMYGPAPQPYQCKEGQWCVAGCCKGWEDDTRSLTSCSTRSDESCDCPPDICEIKELEIRTADDPNAKLGPAEAAQGELISYTLQYENLGAGTAYGVYVTDVLSPWLDADTLVIDDGGEYFSSSRTLYWYVGELGPGGKGELHFSVQVPLDTPVNTVITNSATVYFPSVPQTTPTGDVVTIIKDIVAHTQEVETAEGESKAITLTGYAPSGSLEYSIVSPPIYGSLTGSLPNITYTPDDNFEGMDRFTFIVDNGMIQSEPTLVTINVITGDESIPPRIFSTSPANGETDVSITNTPNPVGVYAPLIKVYFDEPMSAESLNENSYYITDSAGHPVEGVVTYVTNGAAQVLLQESLIPFTKYTATLTTAVKDSSGNPLAAKYSWSFTTGEGEESAIYLPLIVR